jgi:iron complex outermembrane receptor protein
MAMSQTRAVPRHSGNEYDKTDHRVNAGAYAEQNVYVGKWSASAGVLFNRNNYTGKKLNINPGIDVAFYPNRLLKIYASANRAMRLPTFTDLYYQGPMNMGNPDLKPEHSTEYELGAKMSAGVWNAGVSYFYRIISDGIDWIQISNPDAVSPNRLIWHTENLTKLHTQGVSLHTRWDLKQAMGKSFPIHSVSVAYNYMHSDKNAEHYVSYYVLDYLKHQLTVSLTHRIVEKINAVWQVGWQERNGTYMQYNIATGAETEMPYGNFWQIDLRIYRQTQRLNIFAEASNLTNQKHQDIGNITLPGIWVRGGMSITIKDKR